MTTNTKKARIYQQITNQRIYQNWPKLEKLCKEQDNKNLNAAKHALKEHRHLFFKLLTIESGFESFIKNFSKFDGNSGFSEVIKACTETSVLSSNNANSSLAKNILLESNLQFESSSSGHQNTKSDHKLNVPFPSSGLNLSKLKLRDKSKDRSDKQEAEGQETDQLVDNPQDASNQPTEFNKESYRDKESGKDKEKEGKDKDKETGLKHFISKFKDLRISFKKLPKDKKKELVEKFRCYGYIEATIHLARCHFYANEFQKAYDLLDEILADKFDGRVVKANLANNIMGLQNSVLHTNDNTGSESHGGGNGAGASLGHELNNITKSHSIQQSTRSHQGDNRPISTLDPNSISNKLLSQTRNSFSHSFSHLTVNHSYSHSTSASALGHYSSMVSRSRNGSMISKPIKRTNTMIRKFGFSGKSTKNLASFSTKEYDKEILNKNFDYENSKNRDLQLKVLADKYTPWLGMPGLEIDATLAIHLRLYSICYAMFGLIEESEVLMKSADKRKREQQQQQSKNAPNVQVKINLHHENSKDNMLEISHEARNPGVKFETGAGGDEEPKVFDMEKEKSLHYYNASVDRTLGYWQLG